MPKQILRRWDVDDEFDGHGFDVSLFIYLFIHF